MKEFTEEELDKTTTEVRGFIHAAYPLAVEGKNVEVFNLLLKQSYETTALIVLNLLNLIKNKDIK